jgi:hypothetical protein
MSSSDKCPVARTPMAKLHHGYEQVAAAFAVIDYSPLEGRGGITRADERPRATRVTSRRAPHPDLHVESTFDAEQREYIALCVAGLNKLTRGEVLASAKKLPTLLDRIQGRFLADGSAHGLFRQSVAESTISLFDQFGAEYPNLTPALEGMARIAGVEGAIIAIGKSGELLRVVQDERKARATQHPLPDLRFVPNLTGSSFMLTHNTKQWSDELPEGGPYEIWCLGEAFARSIIRNAGDAALKLAQVPGVIEEYKPAQDNRADDLWIRDQLDASVERSLEAARPA